MRDKLIALSIVKKGNWSDIYQFLKRDRNLSSIDEKKSLRLVSELKYDVITLIDQDYPSSWREMSKPPFVVYLKGNRRLLEDEIIGVIGGKNPSLYTKNVLENLMVKLPKEKVVATGFEFGVEAIANGCCRKRIACLASGFEADLLYQEKPNYKYLTEKDLMLSELPPHEKFNLQAYYRSYHLIAEMSRLVCIFELPNYDLRVKYMNYLTEIGKPVVVLPDKSTPQTAGGLSLLNHGAKCLLSVGDIMI